MILIFHSCYPVDVLCYCVSTLFFDSSIYFPKTRVLTRCIEHQQDSMSGKWESSGATEHTKECHEKFDWLHPKTVRISPYMYERKIQNIIIFVWIISGPVKDPCNTKVMAFCDNSWQISVVKYDQQELHIRSFKSPEYIRNCCVVLIMQFF